MIFNLKRDTYALYGILGKFQGEGFSCETLEHAYKQPDGSFLPKLAPGTYTFKLRASPRHHRDLWTLESAPAFMGAPVTVIEIHKGNGNNDSEGCILVALERGKGFILESEKAFDAFMELTKGLDEITLVVS